jgi:FHS family L-fucose permease-like MFS transporter
VRAPYVLLAGFTFLLAIVTGFVHLPELIEKRTEGTAAEGSALQFVHLRLGAIAIFTYVGAEVAIGSMMINFLGQPSMGSLSHTAAAVYVSLYWFGAMIGRFIGSFALLYIRAERALRAVAISAFLLVAITIFGHGHLAMWAIVACGLFNSVMWPCIFPLSVKGLGKFTSQGSGILITMVVGGAVIPEIQGLLADTFGYQHSFAIVLLCYAYLIYFALSGYRIRQPRFPSLPDFVPPVGSV